MELSGIYGIFKSVDITFAKQSLLAHVDIFNGGHIASPLSVRTSGLIRTKNGFWAISFDYICVLDSYFIHRYIILKKQVRFDFGYNPMIIIRVMALDLRKKNVCREISSENINLLDSYFIHRYIIITYRSSSIKDKIY